MSFWNIFWRSEGTQPTLELIQAHKSVRRRGLAVMRTSVSSLPGINLTHDRKRIWADLENADLVIEYTQWQATPAETVTVTLKYGKTGGKFLGLNYEDGAPSSLRVKGKRFEFKNRADQANAVIIRDTVLEALKQPTAIFA